MRTRTALLLVASVGVACAPDKSTAPSSSVDTSDPATVQRPRDCPEGAAFVQDATIDPTDIPTVFEISFQTDVAAAGQVFVVDAEGRTRAVSAQSTDGLDHTGLLLGLAPATDYSVYVGGEASGELGCAGPFPLTTGRYPASLKLPHTTTASDARASGYHLLPIMSSDAMSLAIFDDDGVPIWGTVLFEDTGGGAGESNVPFTFRMRLDPQGRGVVYNTQSPTSYGAGNVTTLSWQGEVLDAVDFSGGHTDFDLLPGGGIAMLGWDVREVEGRRLLGDTVLVYTPGEGIREIWNAFDTFTPNLDRTYPEGFTEDAEPAEDWSHANGLTYDPSDDAILITVVEPQAVVKLDRATGETTWVLSTDGGDFRDQGPQDINMPHGVQPIEGGILVFNRTRADVAETCSNASDLILDLETQTVTRTAELTGPRCRKNSFLGCAHRVASGNTIITWSSLGLVEELTPEGEVLFDLTMSSGAGFGFGTYAPTLNGVLEDVASPSPP